MSGLVPGSGELDALDERLRDWHGLLEPGNTAQEWFVEQVAITSMKIERTEVLDEQLRNSVALKAGLFWDDDRQLDAIKLGQRIADEPEAVVNQLRRTPQGCDWLIARWEPLARHVERNRPWTKEQMAEAQHLLGRPGDGCEDLFCVDQRGLAHKTVAGLRERKAKVAPADAHDRAMAEADLVDVPTVEAKRLRRYEVSLHRRLRWYLNQVPKLADKPPVPPIEVKPARPIEVVPPEPSNRDVVAKAETEVEVEVVEAPRPTPPAFDHPESTTRPENQAHLTTDREVMNPRPA